MEVFTPPPKLVEKRPTGRQPKLLHETRLLIGRKCTSKEMTYADAAKAFGISQGAVGKCVELFKREGLNQRRSERSKERSDESRNYHHQAQIRELKQEIADLYLENQMLKKIISRPRLRKNESGSVITAENLAESQEAAE